MHHLLYAALRARIPFAALHARIQELGEAGQRDRGETGPIGYAFMVSAIVLIAVAVAAWGQDVADLFMEQIAGVSPGGGGGDGGGDGGGGG